MQKKNSCYNNIAPTNNNKYAMFNKDRIEVIVASNNSRYLFCNMNVSTTYIRRKFEDPPKKYNCL